MTYPQRRLTVCHEYRTWLSAREAQEPRRDLWQEFEESKRSGRPEPVAEDPAPREGERADEPDTAGA